MRKYTLEGDTFYVYTEGRFVRSIYYRNTFLAEIAFLVLRIYI